MGTWGPNNFDSDHAGDFYIEEIVEPLHARVARIIADPIAIELDEEGESVLMPCVDVLATLAESYRFLIAAPDEVQQWRDTYLAAYDGYIDKLKPAPGFKEQRRAVIAQTFDRLAKACKDAQDA